ncbi:MAG: helix-turn-helix domain-containing protein [Clostridia bacterium]|nr:helix-turn-helix domain-containing protein [Clostridia bacterium]
MKRVQELFALDLTDVNTCFELLFSFWLRDNLPAGEEAAEGEFDAQAAQAMLWRHVERVDAMPASGETAAYACRLLCVGVSRLPDAQRVALLQEMREKMGDAGACAFDEDVLLFALPPERMEDFAAACRLLCDEKKCQTAVTQTFRGAQIAQRARLCRMALCAATQMHARTQDMCSTLFFMTMERRISLAPYLREDVIRVMDDDAMRGAALSRSLYAYLLHFRDMKKAAAQLGIHRNTMEYQMRKIDAIIGKPEGENARFLMMCTYKILALPDGRRFGL